MEVRSHDLYGRSHDLILRPSEMWMGEYKGRKVAIKSMKEIKSAQATQQLLAEASIMT